MPLVKDKFFCSMYNDNISKNGLKIGNITYYSQQISDSPRHNGGECTVKAAFNTWEHSEGLHWLGSWEQRDFGIQMKNLHAQGEKWKEPCTLSTHQSMVWVTNIFYFTDCSVVLWFCC